MKNIIENLKFVNKGTFIRSVVLFIVLSNQTIAVFGATSYANALWYQVASVVVTIATALFTAWKNNDFTAFAKLGTDVMHALKDGKITPEEVVGLLGKKAEKK